MKRDVKNLLIGFVKYPDKSCYSIASQFKDGMYDVCRDVCPFHSYTCEAWDGSKSAVNNIRKQMSIDLLEKEYGEDFLFEAFL